MIRTVCTPALETAIHRSAAKKKHGGRKSQSRYIDGFNETLPAFLLQSNWQELFNLASWRNFKAIVISFLGLLLLTFVDDMFHGNMAVLVEFHIFHLSFVEQKLDCGQMF